MVVSGESPGLHCEGMTVVAASSLCRYQIYWLLVDSRWYVDTGLLLCWHQLRWPCSLPCPACAAGAAHCSGEESWARAAVRYLQYLHTDIYSIYTLISRYLGCYIVVPPCAMTRPMLPMAACPRCEDARRQCWHDHGPQLVPAQSSAADAMFPGRVQISTQISIDRYLHRFMIRRTFRFSQQMKTHSILLVNL